MNLQSVFSWPNSATENGVSGFRIPNQVHFIWGLLAPESKIPRSLRRYLKQWNRMHRQWSLEVHDADALWELSQHYQQFPFASYQKDIQRSDACRPMLMHRFGGIYTDLDVEPHISMSELLRSHPRAGIILGVEVQLSQEAAEAAGNRHHIRQGKAELPRRIANFWMASVPGHPFWIDVMELMKSRADLKIREQYDILYTTGPDVITEVLESTAGRYDDIVVLESSRFSEILTHHCKGSWRNF